MKKILFIILPLLLVLTYIFSAMNSFHQIHKGIYYSDKKLIKEYVMWDELRENFKDYFNVMLLKKTQEDENLKNLGELRILVTGFAGKIIEYTIDTYLNPEGLSLLLDKSKKKNEIPKPTLITFFGSFTIMNFDGISSFYIIYKNEGEELPIFFNRQGLKWKITQIEFSERLFDNLNY
tara:strand:+ start:6 stop:539 length:534 start_codon:yes stop_codon:yes gene_type:complete